MKWPKAKPWSKGRGTSKGRGSKKIADVACSSLSPDSSTSLYCVFGHPVGHSLSPAMHNKAFAHTGENAVYLAFDVPEIGPAMEAFQTLGIAGASVTIPHKVSIIPFLDEVDPVAQKMGAVNTVVREGDRLVGKNSDCLGAVQALLENTRLLGKKALVLGAGGAARAVALGLLNEGCQVTLANRTVEKGKNLAHDLGAEFSPLDEMDGTEVDVVVNTTSVGMTPNIDASPVRPDFFQSGMVVMDIVYRPLQTQFLKDAHNAGCATVDGLAMFVYQGASQFTWWTGKTAPVEVMRNVVMDNLGQG